jgi:N-acetylglucosaminyldiphosphoundecaprenol N-acetyl-beta-D-mannosaminyltransferase
MDILGVRVDNLSKEAFLQSLSHDIAHHKRGYVVTPYSHFFVHAAKDKEFKKALENSSYSLADGFGVLLASKYISMKPGIRSLIICLWKAITDKSFFDSEIHTKISGSEIVYDVAGQAAEQGHSIFFLGGFDFGQGNTGELAAEKLKQQFPSLKIAGVYSGSSDPAEEHIICEIITKSKPNILFVAYGPVHQEKWLMRNIHKLPPMIGFGLGGTFDYVSGSKKHAPKWISKAGLEGILRPFTSEGFNIGRIVNRLKRSWIGIWAFLWLLLIYKKPI